MTTKMNSSFSRKRRSADDAADGGAPVYRKFISIFGKRANGYPIIVTQGVAQHDAILLDCNDDENPKEYLAKFADDPDHQVLIHWSLAGYNAYVPVSSITLKKIDAAPPVRKAAMNSGLSAHSSTEEEEAETRSDDDDEAASAFDEARDYFPGDGGGDNDEGGKRNVNINNEENENASVSTEEEISLSDDDDDSYVTKDSDKTDLPEEEGGEVGEDADVDVSNLSLSLSLSL